MKNKLTNILMGVITLAAIAVGIVFYSRFPEQMATHWNAAGQVNGTMGKFWGTFIGPIFMLGLWVIYLIIPKIDPLKKNIERFRDIYNAIWVIAQIFLFYIFAMSYAWNLGYRYNMAAVMAPAMAALFIILGVLLTKTKRNWFVGIRTPWTLSSDVVWEKTNKLGGKLFVIVGVIDLLGLFLPNIFMPIFIATLVILIIFLVVYSYVEYRKIGNNAQQP